MHRSFPRNNKHPAPLIDFLEPRRLFSALTFTTLSTFASGTPAAASTVAMDTSGDVFGTAAGGSTGDGFIWVLRKVSGSYETTPVVLASFPTDGSFGNNDRDGLVIDSKGNLFGTNADGYSPFTSANVGTLWELPKTASGYGSLQLLKAFTDLGGQVPDALLTVDSHDNVFGNVEGVVNPGNTASIFEYSAAGGYHDLFNYDDIFDDPGGIGGAESNLVIDNQGNLYGTIINGGAQTHGGIFEIPVGYTSIQVIASFDSVHSNPHGQISILNNGTSSEIFGIGDGDEGGFTNTGDVWELPVTNGTAGGLISLGVFTGTNGDHPSGGTILTPDGNLYGTTSGTTNSTTNTAALWECVSTGGVFGAPQTVLTFPVDISAYPASGLVTDGTNLFGTTTEIPSTNGGIIYGIGPNTIPTTAAPATTYLLPKVTKTNLPATAIGGQAIKGFFNVTVTNTTAALEKGLSTVGMYAYDGTNFFLLGSQKHAVNLKPGKTATFRIAIKGALNAGTYSVLPYSFDPANQETGAASAQPLQVNAPVITLTASALTPVKPAKIKLGKSGNFTVTITNTGNISTSGLASIVAGLSIDGVTTAVTLPALSHAYIIKAGHKIVLHVRLLIAKTLTSGSYFPMISYTQDGIAASAVGAVAFVVTG